MLPSVHPDLMSCFELLQVFFIEMWQIIILCRPSLQRNLYFPCLLLITVDPPPPPHTPRQTSRLKTDTALVKSSVVRQHHVGDQRANTRCLLGSWDSTVPGQQVAVKHRGGCERGTDCYQSAGVSVSPYRLKGRERKQEYWILWDVLF